MTPGELRARREALGLSQEGLAERLRVRANTVARWERGERKIPPFLADALSWHEHRPAASVSEQEMLETP